MANYYRNVTERRAAKKESMVCQKFEGQLISFRTFIGRDRHEVILLPVAEFPRILSIREFGSFAVGRHQVGLHGSNDGIL